MSAGPPQLPNPLTPMAFLPPELAYEVTIATYVAVGSLSVLIWDILSNLGTDYQMLRKGPLRLPLIVYVVSRLGCLGYLLSSAIMETSPVGHCENIRGLEFLYLLSIPPTSLLFLLRIRALYFDNRYVQAFFLFMWLAVLGSSVTPIEGVSGGYIGITKYCIDAHLEPYVSAACIIPLVNDTLVFLATSWKIMDMTHAEQNIKNGVRVMLFGDYLPAFSRSILKDGQLYFLTTISLNLVTAALFNNTSVPVVYRSFVGVPNIVLMNAMACHVFRKIRLGIYKEATSLPTINLVEGQTKHINPISALVFGKKSQKTGITTESSITSSGQNDIDTSVDAEKALRRSETVGGKPSTMV